MTADSTAAVPDPVIHHCGIIRFRSRHKELQQLRLNPVQEFGEFRLPMADIRTQQRLPHPLRHIHRSWIQRTIASIEFSHQL